MRLIGNLDVFAQNTESFSSIHRKANIFGTSRLFAEYFREG